LVKGGTPNSSSDVRTEMTLLGTLRFIATHPANRRHKTAALLDFAKWQVGTRLIPGSVVFDWVAGSRFVVRRGETGLTGNVYCGLHEFADMAFVLHVLRPDDLFVDIGANLGSYTILASAAAGARAFSFEPVPSTFARLVENLRLNNVTDRVTARNVAIGETEGDLAFTVGEDTTNHVLAATEATESALKVPVVPLDRAIDGRTPALIKIDVEGFETPVLRGAARVLRDPDLHSVILEVNGSGKRYGFDDASLLRTMDALGFRRLIYDVFRRRLMDGPASEKTSDNILFVRNVDLVRERLATAPRFVVRGTAI
jgi:FkbM family methyltransferase